MGMVHGAARWESLEAGDAHLTQFLMAEVESAKLGAGRGEDGDKGHGKYFKQGRYVNLITYICKSDSHVSTTHYLLLT